MELSEFQLAGRTGGARIVDGRRQLHDLVVVLVVVMGMMMVVLVVMMASVLVMLVVLIVLVLLVGLVSLGLWQLRGFVGGYITRQL